jgi:hypothetical protein
MADVKTDKKRKSGKGEYVESIIAVPATRKSQIWNSPVRYCTQDRPLTKKNFSIFILIDDFRISWGIHPRKKRFLRRMLVVLRCSEEGKEKEGGKKKRERTIFVGQYVATVENFSGAESTELPGNFQTWLHLAARCRAGVACPRVQLGASGLAKLNLFR